MGKNINLRDERIGLEKYNNEGYIMKIIEYDNVSNIIVEFQDDYMATVHTGFNCFKNGCTKNPYHPTVFGVGITGNKYTAYYIDKNGKKKATKEYQTWTDMLRRCYDEKYKYYTYNDAVVCDEWLLYDNFYEWLHSQNNFEKWSLLERSALDKDIIIKGNKSYSPETCCLVPHHINSLFTKSDAIRGELPIGVALNSRDCNGYVAYYSNGNKEIVYLGYYYSIEEAFQAYKQNKEETIKRIAKEEYSNGNITEKCYNAMMNYEVEITD